MIVMKHDFYSVLGMQIVGLFAILLSSPIKEFYGVLMTSLIALAAVLLWITVCFVVQCFVTNVKLWVVSGIYDAIVVLALGVFAAYAGASC